MLVSGLADSGWSASAATGVGDAFAQLRAATATLVVSDIAMNGGNGFDSSSAIRATREPGARDPDVLVRHERDRSRGVEPGPRQPAALTAGASP
jgi:DNA-binding response OmpR family regulator